MDSVIHLSSNWDLGFTTVSGLPTTGFLESDGYQASRQKSRSPRTWWWKHYTQAQLQVMLEQLGDGPGGILHGGFNPQYMAFTLQEAQKLALLVTNASVPRGKVSPIQQSSFVMSYPSFQCMNALNEIHRGTWVPSLKRAKFRTVVEM